MTALLFLWVLLWSIDRDLKKSINNFTYATLPEISGVYNSIPLISKITAMKIVNKKSPGFFTKPELFTFFVELQGVEPWSRQSILELSTCLVHCLIVGKIPGQRALLSKFLILFNFA